MIVSRHDKSQQMHINRMRAHQMKQHSSDVNTEHNYKVQQLYDPEVSPEVYIRRNGLYGNAPNRQSVNVGVSDRVIEYESNNQKYKPSAVLN